MVHKYLFAAILVFSVLACGSDDATDSASDMHKSPASASTGKQSPDVGAKSGTLVFRTDPVTVEAGREKFMCFTKALDEDVVVDAYAHEGQSVVHHVVFVRPLAPEPDGFSECDVLFRMTWDPLFISGAGSSELKFPEGLGHTLKKGTQLLVQLHLLNSGEADVTETVEISMHRSSAKNPQPVGTYVFGTTDLNLPAGKRSEVEGACALSEPVKMVAAFPHMHRLGRKLHFDAGPSMDDLHELFARDPYEFDDQHTEPVEITLHAGDSARVTCDYDNDTLHDVSFGESTTNEMCFFVGFAVGQNDLRTCLARKAMAMP